MELFLHCQKVWQKWVTYKYKSFVEQFIFSTLLNWIFSLFIHNNHLMELFTYSTQKDKPDVRHNKFIQFSPNISSYSFCICSLEHAAIHHGIWRLLAFYVCTVFTAVTCTLTNELDISGNLMWTPPCLCLWMIVVWWWKLCACAHITCSIYRQLERPVDTFIKY